MTDYDRLAPLYAQVRQRLLERIESGALTEGDFLPAEPDLCRDFGVSRITLRRAVKDLADQGVLIRQQGRGTVVARRKVQQALVSLSGFTDEMVGQGRRVRHEVLSWQTDPNDPEAVAALGPDTAGHLVRILRLIVVDDVPLTLETLYLSPDRTPGVIRPVTSGASFFRSLRETGGPDPVGAERTMNVGFATTDERAHLKIAPSQPVYRIDKTIFAESGQPIAWSRLVTPTNLITYSLRN